MERREPNVRELLELERQIYQESIDRVLLQQEKLHAGELEEFVRRCRPFEADRERELQVAQAQYKFSQRDAQSLLEFDVQQAEDVFQTERAQLKRKLLEGAHRRRLRLEKRLKALDEKDPKVKSNLSAQRRQVEHVTGVDARERVDPKMLQKQLRRAQRRTRRNFNFRHLSGGVLPTPQRIVDDVVDECDRLQRNREREEAEGAAPVMEVAVSEDATKVVCCGKREGGDSVEEVFSVGDAVVLMSRLTEEDFHGFLSAITKDEVKLVLVCGTHCRVTLARLRSGQCTLHQRSEDGQRRENGQGEYHAKIRPPGVATSLQELLQDPPDARRRAAAVMTQLKRKTTIDVRRGF